MKAEKMSRPFAEAPDCGSINLKRMKNIKNNFGIWFGIIARAAIAAATLLAAGLPALA